MYSLRTAGAPGNPTGSAPSKPGLNEFWDVGFTNQGQSMVPGFRKEEKHHPKNDRAVIQSWTPWKILSQIIRQSVSDSQRITRGGERANMHFWRANYVKPTKSPLAGSQGWWAGVCCRCGISWLQLDFQQREAGEAWAVLSQAKLEFKAVLIKWNKTDLKSPGWNSTRWTWRAAVRKEHSGAQKKNKLVRWTGLLRKLVRGSERSGARAWIDNVILLEKRQMSFWDMPASAVNNYSALLCIEEPWAAALCSDLGTRLCRGCRQWEHIGKRSERSCKGLKRMIYREKMKE